VANDYRADIDGLRAVAVAFVVGFHTFPLSVPGGFIGVDVFFVISGYLITGLILDLQRAGSVSIKAFYIRRARRILPALGVVIAATLIIGWFVLFPLPYERLGLHAVAGTLFFPNLVYWSEAGYFDGEAITKPLLHLWSLGVEEQFYLVWPLLLVLLRRWQSQRTAILCALSAVSLIYSSIASFHDPIAAFYSPLSRLWELGAGGILASRRVEVRYPELASFLGFMLIAGAACTLTATSVFPGLLAIIPVGGTAMLIVGRSWILSSQPFVAVGLISYPLYLWHWPLLSFAAFLDFHTELAKGIVVAISIILAWMTTRFIEYPIRFGSLRSYGAIISVTVTFAVSVVAFIIFDLGGLPERYPTEIWPVIATKEYPSNGLARNGSCMLQKENFERYQPECREGEILVWGDSYSAFLATGLPKPYAQFSRSGCLPVLTGSADDCAKSNAAVADEILRLKPRRVILFGRWFLHIANWQSDPKLNEALQHTLHKLRQGIDDVILIGPSPEWPPNLPDVAFRFWSKYGVLPDRIRMSAGNYRATDTVMSDIANSEHVHFISIFDALCNSDGCLTHTPASRTELLDWDYGHMTVEGATYVVNKLGLARFDSPQVK
jgi:peptidoglycan/LPS O-acetylase OafA/YrhL